MTNYVKLIPNYDASKPITVSHLGAGSMGLTSVKRVKISNYMQILLCAQSCSYVHIMSNFSFGGSKPAYSPSLMILMVYVDVKQY